MGKYIVVICMIVALAMAAGCGATLNKSTKPVRDSQGQIVYDKDGNVLMETREFSNEVAFNDTQKEIDANKQPVMSLKAPQNQAITLPPGTELVVWGRNGAAAEVKQYVPESVQVIDAIGCVAKTVAMPTVAVVAVKAASDAKGNTSNTNTYTNSANGNQGNLATAQGGVTGVVNTTALSGISGGGGGSSEGEAGSTSIPVNVTNSGSVETAGDTVTTPADGDKTLDIF